MIDINIQTRTHAHTKKNCAHIQMIRIEFEASEESSIENE